MDVHIEIWDLLRTKEQAIIFFQDRGLFPETTHCVNGQTMTFLEVLHFIVGAYFHVVVFPILFIKHYIFIIYCFSISINQTSLLECVLFNRQVPEFLLNYCYESYARDHRDVLYT